MSKICLSYNQSPIKGTVQTKIKELPSSFWTYGFKDDCIPWENIHRMVNSDYRVYSAGIFEGGYRKNSNWLHQDLMILDIDNDGNEDPLSLNEAKNIFSNYECLVTTTKSHQISKGGNPPADRFRVILRLAERTDCTAEEYSSTMKTLLENMFTFADKKCSDPARFYFGSFDAEYYFFKGERFDFNSAVAREKARQKAVKQIVPVETAGYTGESIIDEFNKNNSIESLLERYGYIQKGKRFISPNSSSGMAGVVIFEGDNKNLAYSHHNSDGWDTAMDAFGLYALAEHNGNLSAAAKALKA